MEGSLTKGKGILATKQEEYIVNPGIVVLIPAVEVHYHGAAKDSSFTHITFTADRRRYSLNKKHRFAVVNSAVMPSPVG